MATARRREAERARSIDGAAALTALLAGLDTGPETDAIRVEVARLRRAALRARPTPKTERARLLQAIRDADVDHQAAVQDHSHQAVLAAARRRDALHRELDALSKADAVPRRPPPRQGTPGMSRVDWLALHLEELEVDLAFLRSTGEWSQVAQLDARSAVAREDLDAARAAAAETFVVDRSVGSVAQRVRERAERLAVLAEAELRITDPDAADAQAAARGRVDISRRLTNDDNRESVSLGRSKSRDGS